MNRRFQIITGEAGSGKTFMLMSRIREQAEKGENIILIVPEQFSSTAEHKLYDFLGIVLYNRIRVETFSRIKRDIALRSGGISGLIPDESAKAAVMYTVRRELDPKDMRYYGSRVKNPAFSSFCMQMARELELNGISPESLAADRIEDSVLSGKMHDISMICKSYDMRLRECGYTNSVSSGREIAEKAAAINYFGGTMVYIDGFKSFTADEKELIDIIRNTAKLLCVAVTTPDINDADHPVFSSVNETVRRICGDDDPDILTPSGKDRFEDAPDIRRLSRSVLRGSGAVPGPAEHIRIAEAADVSSEADYVCTEISTLVRTGKYKYEDIAVLSRCFEDICPTLTDAFERYEIPYFADLPKAASEKPLMIFVLTALEAASKDNVPAETLLRLAKTFYTPVIDPHISELEEYYTTYGIEKESLSDILQTEISYEELCAYDDIPDEEKALSPFYDMLNGICTRVRTDIIRRELLAPLSSFRNSCRKASSLTSLCRMLCVLLEDYHTNDMIAANTVEDTKENRMEITLWNTLGSVIKKLSSVQLPEGFTFELREFREIFATVIAQISISYPAHSLSCVTASGSDRARLDSPKVVFVMSAVSGMFPFKVSESGIFSEKELEMIEDSLGLHFAARIASVAAEENFITYNTLSSPSEELYISYPLADISGRALYPAPLTDEIKKLTGHEEDFIRTAELPPEYFMTTPDSAYSGFIRTLGRDTLTAEKVSAIKEVYGDIIGGRMESAERYYRAVRDRSLLRNRLDPENALRLYTGENGSMRMSASGFESYEKCPFMFFCERGLHLRPVQKLDFLGNIRGSAVHEVLCRLMTDISERAEKNGESFNICFSRMTDEELKAQTDALLAEYLEEKFTGAGYMPSPSFRKSMMKQSDVIIELLRHMRSELSPENSRYTPRAFEYSIGRGGANGMPAWKLDAELSDGRRVTIDFVGSVDRIDTFTDNSRGKREKYIRVVDYKTGTKTFKLSDLLYGVNMQMLLYLFAVTDRTEVKLDLSAANGKKLDFSGYLPSGVLYVPSRLPMPKNTGRLRGDEMLAREELLEKSLKMDGIVLNEPNIIRGMEFAAEGRFIGQKLNTKEYSEYVGKLTSAVQSPKGKDIPPFIAGYCNAGGDAVSACRIIISDDREKYISENVPDIMRDAAYALVKGYDEFIKSIDDIRPGKNDTQIKRIDKAESYVSDIRSLALISGIYADFSEYHSSDPGGRILSDINEKLTRAAARTKYPSEKDTLSAEEFENLRKYTKQRLTGAAARICGGYADISPLHSEDPCQYCTFASICENGVPDVGAYRYPDKKHEDERVQAIRSSGTDPAASKIRKDDHRI